MLTFELQRDQVQLEFPALGLAGRSEIRAEQRVREGGKGKGEEGGERRREERKREGGRGGIEREPGEREREAAISSLNRAQRCRSHSSDMRAECR